MARSRLDGSRRIFWAFPARSVVRQLRERNKWAAFEELRGQSPFGMLLYVIVADRQKGGSTQFTELRIANTSPIHPRYWYKTLEGDRYDHQPSKYHRGTIGDPCRVPPCCPRRREIDTTPFFRSSPVPSICCCVTRRAHPLASKTMIPCSLLHRFGHAVFRKQRTRSMRSREFVLQTTSSSVLLARYSSALKKNSVPLASTCSWTTRQAHVRHVTLDERSVRRHRHDATVCRYSINSVTLSIRSQRDHSTSTLWRTGVTVKCA